MQIRSITIQNFKGIRRKAVIPLAPVTMLFGANSSGKSSILHALLYLYELLVNKNVDPEYSSVTGEHVYLGGFSELINGKDLSKVMTLGVSFGLDASIDFFNTFMTESDENVADGFVHDVSAPVFEYAIEMDIGFSELDNRAFVKETRVAINNHPFCVFTATAGKKAIVVNVINPSAILLSANDEINGVMPFTGVEPFELNLPYKALLAFEQRIDLSDAPVDWAEVCNDKPLAGRVITECALADVVLAPLRHFTKRLQQLIHTGPLRVIPSRSFVAKRTMEKPRWFDGQAGWDAFYFDSSVLQKEVNDWYKVHFKADYQFIQSPTGYGVALTDTKNETALLPAQVGAGISQVFPFVVAAMKTDLGIVSIEQPELHLHPAWQVELADLMLTQTNQYSADKLFFVETHSEHMVLRLLRRVRESKVTPENISIIYMNTDENGSNPIKLDVTSDGDFAEEWPNGFFDERDEELF